VVIVAGVRHRGRRLDDDGEISHRGKEKTPWVRRGSHLKKNSFGWRI
jgi:hypothetical protein